MRAFWVALGFLTTLPVPGAGRVAPGELGRAAALFPLVGWVIGALLYGGRLLLPGPEGLAAGLLLALWLFLTGMLHLDGLLDTADAVFAARSPEARRQILADVHLGSFAFGVGFVHLLLKWQAIAAAPASALLFAPVVARFWLLPLMNLFPAAKREGLGASARSGRWLWGALFALPLLFFTPLAFLLAGLFGALVAGVIARRLGGLAGDAFGALIEVTELVFLLVTVLIP